MEQRMKILVSLQDCDTRIQDIKNRQQEGPIEIQKLEEDLNAIEKQMEEELTQLETHKGKRRKAEQEIDDLESRIEKTNVKLSNIKSNKEYSAVLKEIDDLNAAKVLLEDQIIEIMEQTEALEDRHVAIKAKRGELKEKFEKDRGRILKELKALDKGFKSLEKKRANFCQDIDVTLINRYNLLREHKEGLAISPVVKGVCQTCHMGIPPQKFNELIRGDELMTCPHCKRIMYWGEDKHFSEVTDTGQTGMSE